MNIPPRTSLPAGAGALLLLVAPGLHAQNVTYTFEQFQAFLSPVFSNVAPDSGTGPLHASFTAENCAIAAVASLGVVGGNVLATSGNTIQVSLTTAVNSVSFGFLAHGGNFTVNLSSAVGGTSVTSNPLGAPGLKGGFLSFSSATPFTSFLLTSTSRDWAIDNLVLRQVITSPLAVPENGGTAALFGLALGGLFAFRRRFALR